MMETSKEDPQKAKKELLYDLAVALLGIYIKKIKALIQKYACISMFRAALFRKAQIWKQPEHPSTNE